MNLLRALPALPALLLAQCVGSVPPAGRVPAAEPGVVLVTTLADAGPGSLREAVAGSNRTVRFAVGGEIVLRRSLQIRARNLVVDATSAPAPVRIVHSVPGEFAPAVDVHQTEDVSLRGFTIRAPVPRGRKQDANHDCVRVWRSRRIELSRLSLLDAEDEALEIAASQDVTVSESLFARPRLYNGQPGYCLLVYLSGTDRILVWRNVFEQCGARTPYVATGTRVAVVNNVMRGTVGWGAYVYAWDASKPSDAGATTQVDFEANLFEPKDPRAPLLYAGASTYQPSPGRVSLFLAANLRPGARVAGAPGDRSGVQLMQGRIELRTARAWEHGVAVVPAEELRGLRAGAP